MKIPLKPKASKSRLNNVRWHPVGGSPDSYIVLKGGAMLGEPLTQCGDACHRLATTRRVLTLTHTRVGGVDIGARPQPWPNNHSDPPPPHHRLASSPTPCVPATRRPLRSFNRGVALHASEPADNVDALPPPPQPHRPLSTSSARGSHSLRRAKLQHGRVEVVVRHGEHELLERLHHLDPALWQPVAHVTTRGYRQSTSARRSMCVCGGA